MVSENLSATPAAIHLETIYEETGSSLSSSIVDANHRSSTRQQLSPFYRANYTTHGLISARSIPSVDVHQRRQRHRPPAVEYEERPPIEVRFRDGSTRLIHPTAATTSAASKSRRKQSYSSRYDFSSTSKMNNKYRQIFNTLSKKKKHLPKKPELLLTVITAADLHQAGVTPPLTSSPDESETVTLTKSLSNSSLDTIQTANDSSLKETIEVNQEPNRSSPRREYQEQNRIVNSKLVGESLPLTNGPFPSAYQTQPVRNLPLPNLRQPFVPPHYTQQQQQPIFQHPQQMPAIRSRSLPPSANLPPAQQRPIYNHVPPVAVVPPNQKRSVPSIQITLTNNENERHRTLHVHPPTTNSTSAPSRPVQEPRSNPQKSSFQPSANLLLGGGSRSAFRPFLKQAPVNSIPPQLVVTNRVREPPTTNVPQRQAVPPTRLPTLQQQPQQKQQPINLSTLSSFPLHPSTTITSRSEPRSISLDLAKLHMSDKSSNVPPPKKTESVQGPNPSVQQTNNSNLHRQPFPRSNQMDPPRQNRENVPLIVEPDLQWHSVTSKSLYDVPRLSNRYADIPLRITIPVVTPTHNQKLVVKHDVALEKRLFAAGLSPETIALYERILEVADNLPTSTASPPEIINPYSHQSLL